MIARGGDIIGLVAGRVASDVKSFGDVVRQIKANREIAQRREIQFDLVTDGERA